MNENRELINGVLFFIRLPDRQSLQMVDNLKIIAEKNGDIMKSTSNPQVSSHIRFLSAKVQQYITESSLIEDKVENVVSVDNEVIDCSEITVDIPLIQLKPVECLEVVKEGDKCTESPDLPIENAIVNNIKEISAKDQIANGAIVNINVEPNLPEHSPTVVPITIDICETVQTNEVTVVDVCSSKRKRPETDVYLKKLKYDSPLGLLKVNNSKYE